MANVERRYCPRCNDYTEHYNYDWGSWECERCGREVDDDEDYDEEIEEYYEDESEEDYD